NLATSRLVESRAGATLGLHAVRAGHARDHREPDVSAHPRRPRASDQSAALKRVRFRSLSDVGGLAAPRIRGVSGLAASGWGVPPRHRARPERIALLTAHP